MHDTVDLKATPELPKPDEKLLRPPTFSEKYPWIKFVLLVGLFLFVLVTAIMYVRRQETSPEPGMTASPTQMTYASPTPDVTANWEIYRNQAAGFRVKYPGEYTINEYAPSDPQSVQFLSPILAKINTNFRLTISYRTITGAQTLPELIEQYKLCPSISGQEGVPSLINGETQARIYFDTPCGQYLTTVIYTMQGTMLYIITVDTQAGYDEVKPFVDQIIATLEFTTPNSVSQVSPTVTRPSEGKYFCTLEVKLCPDGSSVGRHGPNCEFAPCPGQ